MSMMPHTKSPVEMLNGSHDLRLPAWGPYSKRYIGISHIPDPKAGLRFDLSVFPGIYRRLVQVPNVLWDSGYHPWQAAGDLSYYSHRHQLIWRDQLYVDIAFCRLDDHSALIHCRATNGSDAPQQLSLHYAASLNFPTVEPYSQEVLEPSKFVLPTNAVWTNGMEYTTVVFGRYDPRASLTLDGQRRGEIREQNFVDGLAFGNGWGTTTDDRVSYRVQLPNSVESGMLLLRARIATGAAAHLRLETGKHSTSLTLPGHGEMYTYPVQVSGLDAGAHEITFSPQDAAVDFPVIDINGFVLVEAREAAEVSFVANPWNPVPQLLRGPRPQETLILRYDHTDTLYGLAWGVQPSVVREFHTDALDHIMRYKVHEHVATTLYGEGKGHYTNVLMQPLFLAPGESHDSIGLVCSGNAAEVYRRLDSFTPELQQWQPTLDAAQQRAIRISTNTSGEKYVFSQERMATTLATNVVYPIRTRGTWIRHCTPGRWWDCLYTWDSGFIGLGLLEVDTDRAIDVLNAYLTPPGDTDAAFIHHGSPVPTQFYLFAEWWNRTQNVELLRYFYPRLQQYHRFLMGRLGSSNTRTLKSGLIRTWDYWYNSGGWDDYPPQVYARNHHLHPRVTPVVNTAHAIRTAKILRMAAQTLAASSAEYEQDIVELGDALQRFAWDDEVGYFSYLMHDDAGNPLEFLHHSSGANFNMGMDGASPLVADCCTPEQTRRLVEHLMTPGRMWSPIGLSTVDQRAPYYRNDGYWNGAVWMAHQWFFWKALLDYGEGDAAYQIAHTALDLWQTEVERTYNCYEHFVVGSGRGAGWHHFGGLSAPVLNWHSAYHRPGRLTVGHNAWVESLEVAPDHSRLSARLALYGSETQRPVVLATLNEGSAYQAAWNGEQVATYMRLPGTTEITLPTGNGIGTLNVECIAARV